MRIEIIADKSVKTVSKIFIYDKEKKVEIYYDNKWHFYKEKGE